MTSSKQSGPTTFSEMLVPIPESIRKVAIQLRKIIKAALPNADEVFLWWRQNGNGTLQHQRPE